MAAAWNDLPATGGLHECAALVSSAEALRVSAPELSVQLARRALLVGATDASAGTTNAGEARDLSMRAQALLASGLVRISQHAKAVEPGFAALALAESGGAPDLAAVVRIDLAACAQQVGEPLLGGAILRPVLESVQTPPSVRATALGRLVGCVGHVARRDDVEDALAEADRLLAADNGLSPEVRRVERARLAVRSAGYHRWYGDTEDAITAAREGLNLLTRLRADLRSECDRLRARLSLELVCGLLDEGELREAEAAAHPVVDEPVRATSAASVGRLMLALATRVYLPGGQTERGRHLLDQAAWTAERHALDGLRADALTELSRLDEQAGRAAEALEALRSARAAEHRRMRAMSRAARIVLVEVGAGHGIRDTSQQSVAALMRQLAHPTGLPVAVAPARQVGPPQAPDPQPVPAAAAELAGTVDMDDEGTRLLDREALFHRLRSVRKGERPVALTLVRLEQNEDDDRGPDTGIMAGLADKVRDMAPDNAELARSDGGELAVILPATTRDQAEEFAANLRETAIESGWTGAGGKDMNISTGVVQTDQQTQNAADMLTAARDALTPAHTSPQTQPSPPQPAPTQPATPQQAAAWAQMGSPAQPPSPTQPAHLAQTAPEQPATPTHTGPTHTGPTQFGSTHPGSTQTGSTHPGPAHTGSTQPAASAQAASPGQTAVPAQAASPEQTAVPGQAASPEQATAAGQAAPGQTTAPVQAGAVQAGAVQAPSLAQAASAESLADTSAALSSALSEDTPTTPLHARPTEQAGRAILSSLTIPSGSGGRRRAGEEQPPGGKSRWPAEPTEAPRWTRAERRAQQESSWPSDPTPTPPGGWSTQAEEPSQGKRAATPDKPSFSETVALNRPELPTRHGRAAPEPDETTRRDLAHGTPAATPESTHTTPNADPAAKPPATPTASARHTTTPAHTTETPADEDHSAATAPAPSPDEERPTATPFASSWGAPTAGDRLAEPAPSGVPTTEQHPAATPFDPSSGAAAVEDRLGGSPFGVSSSTGEERPAAMPFDPSSGAAVVEDRLGGSPFGVSSSTGEERPAATPFGSPLGASGVEDRPAGVASAPSSAGEERPAATPFGSSLDAAALEDRPAGSAGDHVGEERPAATPFGPSSGAAAAEDRLGRSAFGSSTVSAGEERAAATPFGSSWGASAVDDRLAGSAFVSSSEVSAARPSGSSSGSPAAEDRPIGPGAPSSAGEEGPAATPLASSKESAGRPAQTDDASASSEPAAEVRLVASSGVAAGLAGLSSGGTLRGTEDANPSRSSYEETKAELARMMSALNAKSLAAREGTRNGARQSVPAPDEVPERPDVSEPTEPAPVPPPAPGQRSGLMAAFDALTGPLPGLRAEFDGAAELPARRPAESWAELETAAVVESPADELFGTEPEPETEPAPETEAKPRFRSSLGAAFAEFGAPEKAEPTEKKVTEPVKEPVQHTLYDEPIGPQPRPAGLPRRGEKSSATIASLLTEALAAYQSTAEDAGEHRAPERFDSFVAEVADDADRHQSGVTGRHRSPE